MHTNSIINKKYDVVIKAHQKDYYKLDLVVESLRYLNPQPENVYILSPDGFYPQGTYYDDKIVYITDDQVTPFIDKTRLNHRPNWNWINLVSILQTFTENDLYFDVQSDNFFTQPVDLFDSNGRPRIFQSISQECNNKGHRPYFEFSENVFDLPKMGEGYSYIIEFLMYDRRLLKKLIDQYDTFDFMMETIYNNVNQQSYPADQEIFGNLIEKHFPNEYEIVKNVPVEIAGSYYVSPPREELVQFIENTKQNKKECISCSYHTWI